MIQTECTVAGCDRKVRSRDLCDMHYQRFRKHGDPTKRLRSANNERLEWLMNILSKPETDDCIEWPYSRKAKGYGRVIYQGRQVHASRAVLMIATGEDPPHMQACHDPVACNNRWCVNRRHLYWGTPMDNSADMVKAGTLLVGEKTSWAKLTEDDVRAIRSSENSLRILADRFGVSVSAVHAVRQRRTWKHV